MMTPFPPPPVEDVNLMPLNRSITSLIRLKAATSATLPRTIRLTLNATT